VLKPESSVAGLLQNGSGLDIETKSRKSGKSYKSRKSKKTIKEEKLKEEELRRKAKADLKKKSKENKIVVKKR